MAPWETVQMTPINANRISQARENERMKTETVPEGPSNCVCDKAKQE
jgi:hypothetical protein